MAPLHLQVWSVPQLCARYSQMPVRECCLAASYQGFRANGRSRGEFCGICFKTPGLQAEAEVYVSSNG